MQDSVKSSMKKMKPQIKRWNKESHIIRDHKGKIMNYSVNINNINKLFRVLCLPVEHVAETGGYSLHYQIF